jgi:hypothetical protein
MALTTTQQQQIAALWAFNNFVTPNAVAHFSLDQIIAAVVALDGAFDTTLSAAVVAVGGGTTVLNGLNAIIPAPFSTATTAQKTQLCCYVLMKRAGIL